MVRLDGGLELNICNLSNQIKIDSAVKSGNVGIPGESFCNWIYFPPNINKITFNNCKATFILCSKVCASLPSVFVSSEIENKVEVSAPYNSLTIKGM